VDKDGSFSKLLLGVLNAKLLLVFVVLAVSDWVESFSWPRVVPINRAAVDDRGELTATISELVTNGWESQHDMQTLTALWDEVGVDFITISTFADCTSSVWKIVADAYLLIWWEEIGNLTGVQQIVNVFKETLLHDLGVWEEELDCFFVNTTLAEHLFNVFVPLLLTVGFCDFDGEGWHLVNAGSQSSHWATTRTTDTD
jgi:hypothetical protein